MGFRGGGVKYAIDDKKIKNKVNAQYYTNAQAYKVMSILSAAIFCTHMCFIP